MIFKRIYKKIYIKIHGNLKWAIKEGLSVGQNVSVMSNVNFGSEPYLITLGNNVRISFDVAFITHDGGTFVFRNQEKYKSVTSFGKIVVGNNTFIGAKAIIMPGVRIGNNCVIGAGSVVSKSIPDNSVAVGVPARVINTTDYYAVKKYMNMPKNWDDNAYHSNKKEYLIGIIDQPK